MAKLRVIQSAMNAGELSPKLRGRTEIPRYQHGLELCRNALPIVEGGVTRAPGSRFCAAAAGPTVLLVPFKSTASGVLTGWMLEFGNLTIRFFKEDAPILTAGLPYEVASIYSGSDLAELNFDQNDNVLYLWHPDHPPQRLTRTLDDDWTFEAVPFTAYPYQRPPNTTDITLAPSAVSGSVTLTASDDFFSAGHVGLNYIVNGAIARITAYTNPTTATALMLQNILVPAKMISYTDTATVVITKASLSGSTILQLVFVTKKTASGDTATTIDLDLNVVTDPETLPTGITSDTFNSYNVVDGKEEHTATLTLTINPATLAGDTTLTVTATAERKQTVGLRAGIEKLFSYNLTTTTTTPLPAGVAVAVVKASTPTTGTEADENWQEIAWSDLRGWPRCGTFFEQRLIMSGSNSYPTYIWGSKIAKIFDMTIGTLDDEGFSFPMAAATTPVSHLSSLDKIFAMTFDKELSLDGDGKPLTPTTPSIKTVGTNGSSSTVRPLQLSSSVYFISTSGKQLRGIEYSLSKNGYIAPDLGIFASHLLQQGGGIVAMAYSREPYGVIWGVTANGQLLTLTIDKDQDVAAWSRHGAETTHSYKSVAVVPDSSGTDKVWLAVERTLNGTAQTFIETIDYSLNTMAAVTATAAPKTVWNGLDHLNGATVDIVADGFVGVPQVVTAGAITLPSPASSVEIGLNYITTIKDLPLDLAQQETTAQGSNMQVAKSEVRLHETSGGSINGERLPFQKFGAALLDQAVKPFSGDKLVQSMGRGPEPADSQVTITQDKPLGLTVLAIIKQVAIND